MLDISIVIPLLNEEDSISELYQWISRVVETKSYRHEIIFIDDGSTDNSWSVIQNIQKENASVKGIRFLKNYGKSQALHAGFEAAVGNVIITMDADLQDNPEEIPALYEKVISEKYDLVSGWKKKRYDSIIWKNIPSKFFNTAARLTSGIKLHDFNCGLKAYSYHVVKNINVYGEMHRYIPILAKNQGFTKIGEQEVKHQARKYGTTKFGAERFVNGFLDLITIWFISKFGKRPMHFFGLVGTLIFLVGFFLSVYLGVDKLYLNKIGRLITDRPQFFIALTCMILGTQFFLAGFLGEIFLSNKSKKHKRYKVLETI